MINRFNIDSLLGITFTNSFKLTMPEKSSLYQSSLFMIPHISTNLLEVYFMISWHFYYRERVFLGSSY